MITVVWCIGYLRVMIIVGLGFEDNEHSWFRVYVGV